MANIDLKNWDETVANIVKARDIQAFDAMFHNYTLLSQLGEERFKEAIIKAGEIGYPPERYVNAAISLMPLTDQDQKAYLISNLFVTQAHHYVKSLNLDKVNLDEKQQQELAFLIRSSCYRQNLDEIQIQPLGRALIFYNENKSNSIKTDIIVDMVFNDVKPSGMREALIYPKSQNRYLREFVNNRLLRMSADQFGIHMYAFPHAGDQAYRERYNQLLIEQIPYISNREKMDEFNAIIQPILNLNQWKNLQGAWKFISWIFIRYYQKQIDLNRKKYEELALQESDHLISITMRTEKQERPMLKVVPVKAVDHHTTSIVSKEIGVTTQPEISLQQNLVEKQDVTSVLGNTETILQDMILEIKQEHVELQSIQTDIENMGPNRTIVDDKEFQLNADLIKVLENIKPELVDEMKLSADQPKESLEKIVSLQAELNTLIEEWREIHKRHNESFSQDPFFQQLVDAKNEMDAAIKNLIQFPEFEKAFVQVEKELKHKQFEKLEHAAKQHAAMAESHDEHRGHQVSGPRVERRK